MSRFYYLLALALLCSAALVQQIALTRLLSVLSSYYLAFFALGMAMLGLTAGAVYVAKKQLSGDRDTLRRWLPKVSLFYAFSTFISTHILLTNTLWPGITLSGLGAVLVLIAAMALPFALAGIAISLALTRSPYRIGITYGADLAGAAIGCLLAVFFMSWLSVPSVLLVSTIIALLSSVFFVFALTDKRASRSITSQIVLASMLLCWIAIDKYTPNGLHINPVKESRLAEPTELRLWNSISTVSVSNSAEHEFFLWGASPLAPSFTTDQRLLRIDGLAGTPMYSASAHDGNMGQFRYDITNLAYTIRHSGSAAVIGVGGGRDVLSAFKAGFSSIDGIELNPIFIDLLTKLEPYKSFAGLSSIPGITYHVAEARGWFARSTKTFDLIQMSMIDSWASTGIGSHSLSENALYTVEAWQHFLRGLSPNGVFTVSRWFLSSDPSEAGRMLSLAVAALLRENSLVPSSHIYVAANEHLATLILGKSPLTREDIDKLDTETRALGFNVLARPGEPSDIPSFRGILEAQTEEALIRFTDSLPNDLSPSTDNRPYFFNQLRLFDAGFWSAVKNFLQSPSFSLGVIQGNLNAVLTLGLMIILSLVIVVFTLLTPLHGFTEGSNANFVRAGSLYFFLIGAGFMLSEVALIQRLSIFMGNPVYSLSIVLFSMILAAGIGSLFSDYAPLKTAKRFFFWAVTLATVLCAISVLITPISAFYEASSFGVRTCVTVAMTAIPAFLMGWGFPTGLSLTNRIDPRPSPWFWGINGAAGVLASGLAVAISMEFSIPTTIFLSGVCYLALCWPAYRLFSIANRSSV